MIVRALVDDHPKQSAEARELLSEPFIVTASVILETEWVLRSQYHWQRQTIASSLREIVDLPGLAELPSKLRWAIDRFADGADFADMIHLISAEGASAFVTFDRRLARKAGSDAPVPIETLV